MSFLKKHVAVLALTVIATGCAVASDPANPGDDGSETFGTELPAEAEETGTTTSALIEVPDWRDDYVSDLTLHNGWYGDWHDGWCPQGTYATHYRQRVERSQGGGDDTALNSVTLFCRSPRGGETFQVTPHPGLYGDESNTPSCGSNSDGTPRLMIGGQIRVEDKQGGDNWYRPFKGSTDDSAANDVHMKCPSGTAEANREGQWGRWYQMKTCPTGTAVCGLSIRVEEKQGGGDDTGMNGMHLMCCSVR